MWRWCSKKWIMVLQFWFSPSIYLSFIVINNFKVYSSWFRSIMFPLNYSSWLIAVIPSSPDKLTGSIFEEVKKGKFKNYNCTWCFLFLLFLISVVQIRGQMMIWRKVYKAFLATRDCTKLSSPKNFTKNDHKEW